MIEVLESTCNVFSFHHFNWSCRYDLDNRDGELVTFLKREVKSVKFIDFSTDNSYLLYKAADGSDKSTIINIISKAEVDLNLVEFNVEWVSDGIQLSKFTKVFL